MGSEALPVLMGQGMISGNWRLCGVCVDGVYWTESWGMASVSGGSSLFQWSMFSIFVFVISW